MLSTRLRRALAALVVATAVCTVGLVATGRAPRAGATCNGTGAPVARYTYDASGTLVAAESVAYPGTTCNGDAVYQGAVLDPVTDGSCAYAYYLEPLAYYAAQGTSCTTGAWRVYSYTDVIGSNSVFVSVRPSYLADLWTTSSGY